MKKIALFIAAVISAPALAWTNGDITKELNFGGSVTPEQYSQLWQWKVGTGLNNFYNYTEHMSDNFTRLTVEVTEAKPILLGSTKSALVSYNGMSGLNPVISFTGFDDRAVTLEQDTTDKPGTGYFNLPVKDTDTNKKIGTVKVNATAVGLGVNHLAYPSGGHHKSAYSIMASNNADLFYGALFNRVIASGYNTGNDLMSKFKGISLNELRQVLEAHPSIPSSGNWLSNGAQIVQLNTNGAGVNAHEGVFTASYALGIDAGQSLELTFDNPITSITQWSAPLNIAVTYN